MHVDITDVKIDPGMQPIDTVTDLENKTGHTADKHLIAREVDCYHSLHFNRNIRKVLLVLVVLLLLLSLLHSVVLCLFCAGICLVSIGFLYLLYVCSNDASTFQEMYATKESTHDFINKHAHGAKPTQMIQEILSIDVIEEVTPDSGTADTLVLDSSDSIDPSHSDKMRIEDNVAIDLKFPDTGLAQDGGQLAIGVNEISDDTMSKTNDEADKAQVCDCCELAEVQKDACANSDHKQSMSKNCIGIADNPSSQTVRGCILPSWRLMCLVLAVICTCVCARGNPTAVSHQFFNVTDHEPLMNQMLCSLQMIINNSLKHGPSDIPLSTDDPLLISTDPDPPWTSPTPVVSSDFVCTIFTHFIEVLVSTRSFTILATAVLVYLIRWKFTTDKQERNQDIQKSLIAHGYRSTHTRRECQQFPAVRYCTRLSIPFTRPRMHFLKDYQVEGGKKESSGKISDKDELVTLKKLHHTSRKKKRKKEYSTCESSKVPGMISSYSHVESSLSKMQPSTVVSEATTTQACSKSDREPPMETTGPSMLAFPTLAKGPIVAEVSIPEHSILRPQIKVFPYFVEIKQDQSI